MPVVASVGKVLTSFDNVFSPGEPRDAGMPGTGAEKSPGGEGPRRTTGWPSTGGLSPGIEQRSGTTEQVAKKTSGRPFLQERKHEPPEETTPFRNL
jgi:hypothetical protein